MTRRLAKQVWPPSIGVFLCIVSLFLFARLETLSVLSSVLVVLVMVALVVNLVSLAMAVVVEVLLEVTEWAQTEQPR